MEPDAGKPLPDAQLMRLADALADVRDALVAISLALTDVVTETSSQARDETLAEVERYLSRIRARNRQDPD